MSKCISAHGEYSEHEGTGEFCDWCGDCNHAAILAAAEQRGAERALRDAAQVLREDVDIVFNKHRGIFFREDEADRKGISPWGWLENRADQIADQEVGDE